MNPFRFIRSMFALVVALLLTLLISLATILWVLLLKRPIDRMLELVRWWGRSICRVSGVTVTVEGLDHLTPGRPCIFAANHQSQFDILALQGFLPTDFRWLAKKELFKVPIWGRAMRLAGYIPIDRSHGRQALKSLVEAAQRIAEGTSVVIFPEGTRSRDGRLQPFKSGGMMLAIKSGVDLVPVGITGSYSILPKGKLVVTPGHIRIRIGTPISTGGYHAKQKHELAERLRHQIQALLDSKE